MPSLSSPRDWGDHHKHCKEKYRKSLNKYHCSNSAWRCTSLIQKPLLFIIEGLRAKPPRRILAQLSISLGFVRILALPGFENISRFYNRGQNSLRKPNTNRTKTTCLLLPPTPSPYAMTTEHGQPKNHTLTVSPFVILHSYFSLPPSPLCNVDVASDACQETVRDPKDNIESGGGGSYITCTSGFILEHGFAGCPQCEKKNCRIKFTLGLQLGNTKLYPYFLKGSIWKHHSLMITSVWPLLYTCTSKFIASKAAVTRWNF